MLIRILSYFEGGQVLGSAIDIDTAEPRRYYLFLMKPLCRFTGIAIPVILALLLAISGGCSKGEKGIRVGREQLFTLGYGSGEDRIDLFSQEGAVPLLKTCITMREGIFYVSNGNGAKVTKFSSFGDILSMIYNPERGVEPLMLSPRAPSAKAGGLADDAGLGRFASTYPFRANGEVAVDSAQTLYVEDRADPEREVTDPQTGSILDRIVTRFSRNGQNQGFLGQEGMGGTPFNYIQGIYVNEGDDCIVVSESGEAWFVHWFDKRGSLIRSLKILRSALPLPRDSTGLSGSLDRILPDVKERRLVLKVDYYRDVVDRATNSPAGIDYAGSWVYALNLDDASIAWQLEVPSGGSAPRRPTGSAGQPSGPIPGFLGLAGSDIYFMSVSDDGSTQVMAMNRSTKAVIRYSIEIAPNEMNFAAFFLSREGILCALLAREYEANLVWWRFDRMLLRGLSAERSGQ